MVNEVVTANVKSTLIQTYKFHFQNHIIPNLGEGSGFNAYNTWRMIKKITVEIAFTKNIIDYVCYLQ